MLVSTVSMLVSMVKSHRGHAFSFGNQSIAGRVHRVHPKTSHVCARARTRIIYTYTMDTVDTTYIRQINQWVRCVHGEIDHRHHHGHRSKSTGLIFKKQQEMDKRQWTRSVWQGVDECVFVKQGITASNRMRGMLSAKQDPRAAGYICRGRRLIQAGGQSSKPTTDWVRKCQGPARLSVGTSQRQKQWTPAGGITNPTQMPPDGARVLLRQVPVRAQSTRFSASDRGLFGVSV